MIDTKRLRAAGKLTWSWRPGPAFVAAFVVALMACVPAQALEGVVLSPDGKRVANLQVRVFTADDFAETAAAERVTTGPQGEFRITGTYDQPVVLEIRGERGAGRVRWGPADGKKRLSLTYPVTETIILLHDNDQHFDFSSAEAFQARVKGYRQEYDDVFLLNAGDIFTRHPHRWKEDDKSFEGDTAWYRKRALAIIEQMNRVRYDVMTLGNHELAPIETFTREALEKARFPLLATNVKLTTDKLPPVQSQVVLRTGTGRTIGIIGLTTGSGEGVQILNRSRVAAEYAHLADKHDVVVALTHIGHKADRELAEKFSYFDVIIGGHSHTLLEKAETVNGVLVAQAGGNPHQVSKKHPKYLGIITLTLENGRIVNKRGQVITIPLAVEATVP